MNSISSEICIRFKDARRALGLTQTALAQEIGCHQAALSMFEKGNPTKLSEEYVNRLSARLGLDIKALSEELAAEEREAVSRLASVAVGFCPEPECPSNSPYSVAGRTLYRVTLQKGRYCAHCGEVLETRCPHCGAAINEGACCSSCGNPYVSL